MLLSVSMWRCLKVVGIWQTDKLITRKITSRSFPPELTPRVTVIYTPHPCGVVIPPPQHTTVSLWKYPVLALLYISDKISEIYKHGQIETLKEWNLKWKGRVKSKRIQGVVTLHWTWNGWKSRVLSVNALRPFCFYHTPLFSHHLFLCNIVWDVFLCVWAFNCTPEKKIEWNWFFCFFLCVCFYECVVFCRGAKLFLQF